MIKKNMAGLMMAIIPLYGHAAHHEAVPAAVTIESSGSNLALDVTGKVVRECTVSMPDEGAFPLGVFSVNNWVENQSWLRHGTTPEFTFILSGCGEGSIILSVTGTPVNSSDRLHWLANQTGSTPELAASLELVNADGTTSPLLLNGTAYPYADTLDNETVQIKLKGLLNRTNNNHRPSGIYQATLIINFDFV